MLSNIDCACFDMWLTQGHCKNLKKDWDKAASALKGVVNVAAVDATANESLARKYGVQVCTFCHTPAGVSWSVKW